MIVVLSEGEVIETGKHDELFKLKGTYHKLYSTYLSRDSTDTIKE